MGPIIAVLHGGGRGETLLALTVEEEPRTKRCRRLQTQGKAAARCPPPASEGARAPPPGLTPPQTAGKTTHWCCLEPLGLWRCVPDDQTLAPAPGTIHPARHCGHDLHAPPPPRRPPRTNAKHPAWGSGILPPSSLSSPMGTQAQRGCRDHTKHPRNWGAFPELQVPGIRRGQSSRGRERPPPCPKRFSKWGEGAPPGSPQRVSIWPPGKFSFVKIKSGKSGFR